MDSQLLSYPPDLNDQSVHPAAIQFNWFNRKNASDSSPGDKIQLYMPEAVSQPSTVSWDTENFGFVGNAIAAGGKSLRTSILGAGQSGNLQSFDGIIKGGAEVASLRLFGNMGSEAARLMGGNVSAEGLIGAVTGKVPNPYLTAIFRGVNFRQFAFVFKFYPFQESDCKMIDNIIKSFRSNSLPTYELNTTMLGYPSECEISYLWNGTANPWLHKFRRAVCTGIDVDYTGNGMFSTMRNGFPSEITMSTHWSEIKIITRDDIGGPSTQGY